MLVAGNNAFVKDQDDDGSPAKVDLPKVVQLAMKYCTNVGQLGNTDRCCLLTPVQISSRSWLPSSRALGSRRRALDMDTAQRCALCWRRVLAAAHSFAARQHLFFGHMWNDG